jgi:hypothetical protein
MEKCKECGQITRFNGWENHATWAVHLWISNSEGSDSYWREKAGDAWEESEEHEQYLSRKESASIKLRDWLKEAIEENNPIAEDCSIYSDLLGSALQDVSWGEIAEAYLEEYEDS